MSSNGTKNRNNNSGFLFHYYSYPDTKELILFHDPGPEGSFFHTFEEIDYQHYLNKTLRVTLHQHNFETLGENISEIPEASTYTIPLDHFTETIILITQGEDGKYFEHVIIIENKVNTPELPNQRFLDDPIQVIRAPKGESCFGRPPERERFSMIAFNVEAAKRIAEAMLLVSQSLCSKLGKFEAALPAGAGGRVWNIRKSQNREPLSVLSSDLGDNVCGRARIESGRHTHPISIQLNPTLINNSSIMGIAVVIIHEIAHQFGVLHGGWMNTGDYEGALWASHNVENVNRADIASYIESANKEIYDC